MFSSTQKLALCATFFCGGMTLKSCTCSTGATGMDTQQYHLVQPANAQEKLNIQHSEEICKTEIDASLAPPLTMQGRLLCKGGGVDELVAKLLCNPNEMQAAHNIRPEISNIQPGTTAFLNSWNAQPLHQIICPIGLTFGRGLTFGGGIYSEHLSSHHHIHHMWSASTAIMETHCKHGLAREN